MAVTEYYLIFIVIVTLPIRDVILSIAKNPVSTLYFCLFQNSILFPVTKTLCHSREESSLSVIPAMTLGGDHVKNTTRRGEHARPFKNMFFSLCISVFICGCYLK